jgi:hypothetical protein
VVLVAQDLKDLKDLKDLQMDHKGIKVDKEHKEM